MKGDRRNEFFKTFFVKSESGGQQQRVAIARALCCESNLIVADEPTGKLDEDTAKEIVRIFQELAQEEGKCVIVINHDPSIAEASDIVVQLTKGSLSVKNKKEPVASL